MNIIIDEVPQTVEVGGTFYAINTDFRISMLFEMVMLDPALSDADKIMHGLNLYYPQIPGDIEGAIARMMWFYSCGREVGGQSSGTKRTSQIYDFEHDADYIYAAFMQQYGINLQSAKIHWWEWRALFNGLTEDALIVKIMGYRGMEIKTSMSKEEKGFYQKMKKLYEIPVSQTVLDKEEAILAALERGEDIDKLIRG